MEDPIAMVVGSFDSRPKNRRDRELYEVTTLLPMTYFGFKAADYVHKHGYGLSGVIVASICGAATAKIISAVVPAFAYVSPVWVAYSLVNIDKI